MTRLWNRPDDFADEMIEGFVAANSGYVRRVTGGVVRRHEAPHGQVAVIVGGGSGHYPAFGGMVGSGLAHGAAMGNLFASPSTAQVLSVAREAARGGGVLLTYGNYAGDVLNFDAAQRQLRIDGIDCETVLVTDDIASAGPDARDQRRGIAGDLVVFRIAAAAAEAGYSLSQTAAIAERANDHTRTLGVAFSGCMLPGASKPLFEVPEGRMAIGLGIHGEPGVDETNVPRAEELAKMLVSRLLTEEPENAAQPSQRRVVPVLNGLGSLKYEELFVLYHSVEKELSGAGVTIVDPHVGEFCTSFDMAGVSLSLFWLDPELEALWDSPADAPGYKKGAVVAAPPSAGHESSHNSDQSIQSTDGAAPTPDPPGAISESSLRAARVVVDALTRIRDVITDHVEELGALDSIAGDGDHGIGMERGVTAALGAASNAAATSGAGSTLRAAGDAWADRAGGTSGALWGLILRSLADAVGDNDTPTAADLARGWSSAASEVMAVGHASPGDKTMVDALVPFATAFGEATAAGASVAAAWQSAAADATRAAAATADLVARRGRARTHTTKSLGHPDPGAHSLALILTAVAPSLKASPTEADSTTDEEPTISTNEETAHA